MAEQDNESRSSLSSDGAELSIGNDSISPSSDESADMKDLTTASGSEDFNTRKNVAVSHSDDDSNMPAKTFPFLKLPPELRMRVYHYVFCHELLVSFDSLVFDEVIDLRLLQTCRQIYEESRYEVFKCNTFNFDDYMNSNPFELRPLLPDQKSAIRSISARFEPLLGLLDTTFSMDFPDMCEELRQFVSGFKRPRDVEIWVQGSVDSISVDDRFQNRLDDWEEGITILQTLGSLHWEGDMTEPEYEEESFEIEGILRLRIGHGQGLLDDPEFDGVSGNELRLLFRNRHVSWQELMKETITDQVDLNL